MKTIPSNLYPKVLELVNETYTDKMDSIESAQVDEDGTIEAIGIDEGARFIIRYDGTIEIRALEPDKEPNTAGFAAGKARNCKAGISCGNSCISKSKACRKKGTSGQAEKAKEITALVWQPGKGSQKDVPAKANKSATSENTADKERKPTAKELEKRRVAIEDAKELAVDEVPGYDIQAKMTKRRLRDLGDDTGDHAKMSAGDLATVLLDTDGENRTTLLGIDGNTKPKDLLKSVSKKIHPDVNKDPRASKAFRALKDLINEIS